jgi:phenylacetate-CoA ligase
MKIPRTPLENWIREKIGLSPTDGLAREDIERYQLRKMRETISYLKERSPFYHRRLAGLSGEKLGCLGDVSLIPFTSAVDIQDNHLKFLCVSQDAVERVVTLRSSGTTAASKRVYFTAEDLELTADFFHHGMSTMVEPGQKVLCLMPGELPGSVGDLLLKGLRRMDVEVIVHGLVRDEKRVIDEIIAREIDCLVGIPVQVLALARNGHARSIPANRIKSVLLSADYVPDAVVKEINRVWKSPVFNHYGMTETGLGGGVDCRALSGYHLREADLYFEIVDPDTGRPLPDGEEGEVVFSTLTRTGMPLIRYRTGDVARFLPEPCPCGTILKRLSHVKGRLSGKVRIGRFILDITDLDEILFPLPGLINYQAEMTREDGMETLTITLFLHDAVEGAITRLVREALKRIPGIENAIAEGTLRLRPIRFSKENWLTNGSIKKTIFDRR